MVTDAAWCFVNFVLTGWEGEAPAEPAIKCWRSLVLAARREPRPPNPTYSFKIDGPPASLGIRHSVILSSFVLRHSSFS